MNKNWLLITGGALCLGTTAYLLWKKQQAQTKSASTERNPNQATSIAHHTSTKPVTANQPSTSTSTIAEEPNWRSPFDMRYEKDVARWFAPKKIQVIDTRKAIKLAEQIKAADGKWYQNDDEKAIEDVFAKQLSDKVEVAGLARVFYQRYRLDLWEFLSSFLSRKEMDTYVHHHVRKLANYRLL